jgi:serralysin
MGSQNMTTQHSFYEILAKEIVYVFDNHKFDKSVDEFLHSKGYVVDQFFNESNSGFRTFGLLPIAAYQSPILVFGGTSKAIDDIANNHPKGIGFNQFLEHQDAISTWLTKVTQTTRQKSDIVGHALGGAIAQVVATELIDRVRQVVTFSSPGTSHEIATQFLQNGGANLTVTHYIIDGDIISLAGEAFIAGKVILHCFTDRAIKPFHNLDSPKKTGRLLSNPPSGLTQTEISVKALSCPSFTFFNADYLEFLTEYYAINPEVAQWLTSRGKFEALRRSGFSGQKIPF